MNSGSYRTQSDELLMQQYLLGQMSEPEQSQFEEKLFTEEAWGDRLAAVEENLIDDFVSGNLSAKVRERFNTYYLLSHARRERVGSAEALRVYLRRNPPPREVFVFWRALVPQWRTVLAGVIIVAVCGLFAAGWVTRQVVQRRAEATQQPDRAQRQQTTEQERRVATLNTELHQAENERGRLEAQLARRRKVPDVTPVISFLLTPNAVRGGESRLPLMVPLQTSAVQLQLKLPDGRPYTKLRAVLRTVDGYEVWSRGVQRERAPNFGNLTLLLPGNALRPGDYLLVLSAPSDIENWEEVADYTFRILRQ